MSIRNFAVEIDGITPIIFHNDDIEWSDQMDDWRGDPENAKNSKPGDDRFPAYRWLGYLYHDDAGRIIVPAANLSRVLMEGGAQIPVPGARNSKKTFKAQSQSGILIRDVGWPLYCNGSGAPLEFAALESVKSLKFADHKAVVSKLGFELFVKRVRVGQAKHVRVRPRFRKWRIAGVLTVTDDAITRDVLQQLFDQAGTYKGLGDWRPSSNTPGSHGLFTAKISKA
jgi:hypothetical protein